MFDWIPIASYTSIYYTVLLAIGIVVLWHGYQYNIRDQSSLSFFNVLGLFLLGWLVLYIGQRPISGFYFGDTGNYAQSYALLSKHADVQIKGDYLFNYLQKFCAQIMDVHGFFTVVAFVYVVSCYLFSKKYFGSYWFFSFYLFVGSFSFWAYGVNGIRNGLATSVFILALVFYNKKIRCYALMLLAYGFHNSMAIPLAAFIFADLYKNPKWYLYIWLGAIPLSLVAGSQLQSLLGNFFSDNERSVSYLTKGNVNNDTFSSTGFRWDFVLYSGSAVFAGWYYIFKKKIQDRFYIHLYGTFIIANAFWILVIKANFSNRFAYLSWFLMAPVIVYPLVRYKLSADQYKVLGNVIFAYYLFTYFMFLKS